MLKNSRAVFGNPDNSKKKKLKKFAFGLCKSIFVFLLVFSWLFSGWPKIWKNFPPDIPSALADDTFRVTEYYLTTGDFTGTTYNLTLDQNLADNYFVLIKGSRVGDAGSNPDNDYARVYEVPGGKGDLPTSGASNVIALSRHVADFDWEGVITVVECLGDTGASGFQLLDIAQTSLGSTVASGTDTSSIAWSDINQVVLFGAYNGGGAEFEANAASTDGNAVQTRLYPSSTSTINWARNSSMSLLAATMTTFVVEWGNEWTVQRVNVAGSNYGNGCNATGEYSTGTISSVSRANTWVWGTGNSNGNGIGDSATGTVVTLGDGVTENTTETTVGHCTEYNHTRDFDIYTMTHSGLAADYRFKADGDQNVLDIAVTVDTATSGYRFGWVYNSCNGSGSAHPRDRFWARYTADSTVTISRGYDGQVFPAWVQGVDFSGVTYTAVSISVSVSDGIVDYGEVPLDDEQDTTASGVNNTQTATNDGNVTADLNIKTSHATGGTQWSVGATAGANTYVHSFSTNSGSSWEVLQTVDTYETLATALSASATEDFDLKIGTPTSTSDYQQKSITVTVQAVQN